MIFYLIERNNVCTSKNLWLYREQLNHVIHLSHSITLANLQSFIACLFCDKFLLNLLVISKQYLILEFIDFSLNVENDLCESSLKIFATAFRIFLNSFLSCSQQWLRLIIISPFYHLGLFCWFWRNNILGKLNWRAQIKKFCW